MWIVLIIGKDEAESVPSVCKYSCRNTKHYGRVVKEKKRHHTDDG